MKTNNLGFRPSPTQTSLHGHRNYAIEALEFGFKKRGCLAKTKVLNISIAVTANMICAFVFTKAKYWSFLKMWLTCFYPKIQTKDLANNPKLLHVL